MNINRTVWQVVLFKTDLVCVYQIWPGSPLLHNRATPGTTVPVVMMFTAVRAATGENCTG